MGFRFRKSVKIAPGVRLNFGKKSTSVSLGGKGARFTINNKGKKTASFGIPGTGLYYTESVGGTKKRKDKSNMAAMKTKNVKAPKEDKPKKPITKKWWFWTILIGIVFSILTGGGSDTPEEETPQQSVQEEVESVVTEDSAQVTQEETEEQNEVVAENTTTEEETEVPEPVTEENPKEPEKPVEEPKAEPPVVAPVVTPVPEEHVVETPPVVDHKPIEDIVYVSKTGKKYHCISDCSGMKSPIEMTKTEAAKTRQPCENCY